MRLVALASLLILGACDDDIGKDTDPASIRGALCLRVKKPPRARCEAAAKQTARELINTRPKNPAEWGGYSIECQEAMQATARFAPGSSEAQQLVDACCSVPDGPMRDALRLRGYLDRYCPKDSGGKDM